MWLLLVLADRSGGDQADLSLFVIPVPFAPRHHVLQKAAAFFLHVLRHFFQEVLKVVVRIGAISLCHLDKGIHDDRGFGTVRCVAEQPVSAPYAQTFETSLTESVVDGDMRILKKTAKTGLLIDRVIDSVPECSGE